jgi:uncharacterized protein YcbX
VTITTTLPEKLETLPKTLTINLDESPAGNLFKGANHEGYLYPDEINLWFSKAIGRKVLLLHSSGARRMPLNPKRHIHMIEGDVRKTFTTDAALHIVNKASVDDLRQRVSE